MRPPCRPVSGLVRFGRLPSRSVVNSGVEGDPRWLTVAGAAPGLPQNQTRGAPASRFTRRAWTRAADTCWRNYTGVCRSAY